MTSHKLIVKSVVLSIDRVTMMLRTKSDNQEISYQNIDFCMLGAFKNYVTRIESPFYSKSYNFVWDDKSRFLVSFCPKFPEPTNFGLRIEFNPNTLDYAVLAGFLGKIVGYLPKTDIKDFIKFNRVDFALDYPFELNPCMITNKSSHKSFVCSGKDGIESVYFGTRSSDFYMRIYNKKLELFQKQKTIYDGEHLWRFELEMKKEFHINQSLDFVSEWFKKITVYQDGLKSGDFVLDLILFKANSQGYSLNCVKSEIPKGYDRKDFWKKMNAFPKNENINPAKDFAEQIPGVYKDFTQKIYNCIY